MHKKPSNSRVIGKWVFWHNFTKPQPQASPQGHKHKSHRAIRITVNSLFTTSQEGVDHGKGQALILQDLELHVPPRSCATGTGYCGRWPTSRRIECKENKVTGVMMQTLRKDHDYASPKGNMPPPDGPQTRKEAPSKALHGHSDKHSFCPNDQPRCDPGCHPNFCHHGKGGQWTRNCNVLLGSSLWLWWSRRVQVPPQPTSLAQPLKSISMSHTV